MRVLIAEDDPISRRVLQATLTKWGYEVVVACDGKEAWEQLQADDAPTLAILDWMMPHMDGPEVCKHVRQREGAEYAYLILLTARGQKQDVIEGMAAGADDYITKPFNTGELEVRLRAAKRILDLQSELIAAREALREQATHDALTGLWNRSAILEILSREISRSDRENQNIGVVMADLDHFKSINDTFGHKAGDMVLREAARRMKSVLRTYDSLGRYGGEEFLIVLPGCDTENSINQAERLREAIASEPFMLNDQPLPVTVSLGAFAKNSTELVSPDSLINSADTALYDAKHAGRNCVRSGVLTEVKSQS